MGKVNQIGLGQVPGLVRPGMTLFLPGSTSDVPAWRDCLAAAEGCLRNVRVVCGYVSGINDFSGLRLHGLASVTGFFPPPPAFDGKFRLIPTSYYGIDAEVASARPDIVVLPATLPDHAGTVSLGLAADFSATALASAAVRVAILTPTMPRLPHAPQLPLDSFTHVVEADVPLLTLTPAGTDALSAAIAEHVAALVPDGATLQLGIGKIPGLILAALVGRRWLRLHSGIVPEGVRTLHAAGALAQGVSVTCASLGGDTGFYEWLDGCDFIRVAPAAFTHAPSTLANLPNLFALNSAIEVDLAGQVNAEMLNGRRVSAPGGLPDFAHAAHRSAQGMSVIALPSTDRSGRHSRIVAGFAPGTTVTVARIDVDAVVTEHGVADLRGQSAVGRATALAQIAAPQMRADLLQTAKKMSS